MKNILILLIFLSAIFQPAYAKGHNWVEIATDSSGGIYYIRENDLQNSNDSTPEVWIKGYHKADKSVLYRSSMSLYLIDCSKGSYAFLEGTFYHADGRVRDTSQGSRYNTRYIVPDSIMDAFALAACPKEKE